MQSKESKALAAIVARINGVWDDPPIPGVYEVLAEHYNNEVLDRWADENPQQYKVVYKVCGFLVEPPTVFDSIEEAKEAAEEMREDGRRGIEIIEVNQ